MQLPPRRLYALLKNELDLSIRQMGFSRVNAAPLTYSYPDALEVMSLWFEADESGWDPLWGSSFTIELERTPHEIDRKSRRETRARYSALLDREGLERLRAINNAVIAALPGTADNAAVYLVDSASGRETVFAGARAQTTPYGLGWDIWMRYFDSSHVVEWADFLRQHLPNLVDRMKRVPNDRRNFILAHDNHDPRRRASSPDAVES